MVNKFWNRPLFTLSPSQLGRRKMEDGRCIDAMDLEVPGPHVRGRQLGYLNTLNTISVPIIVLTLLSHVPVHDPYLVVVDTYSNGREEYYNNH